MQVAEVIQDLRTEEERLTQQLIEVQHGLDSVRYVRAMYERRAMDEREEQADRKPAELRNGTFGAQVIKTIHAILQEESPLHRKMILERVLARGVHIGTQDPLRTVGAYLTLGKQFRPDGREKGVWALVEGSDQR